MSNDDPFLAAAREVLSLALSEIRGCVEEAPAAALNWRPGGDDTNSIAVLAVHAVASTRSWLSVAIGAARPDRDRDAEFLAIADDGTAFLEQFDAVAGDCAALLDTPPTIDWSAMRTAHSRPGSDLPRSVLAAWALIHALEHLREHQGQMFLTRQLWDQRPAG